MLGDVSLGLGEYLTVWVIIAVILIGILGYIFGVAAGGVFVFIILGALGVLLIYAILSRGYRLLLHGQIRSRGGEE